ncbi:MAG: FAD:protein FMN transferase [Collinsella sp.]
MDEVADRCTYFENKFSRTVEGSDIWNINNAGGKPVEVAHETAEVIEAAIRYAEESDGSLTSPSAPSRASGILTTRSSPQMRTSGGTAPCRLSHHHGRRYHRHPL